MPRFIRENPVTTAVVLLGLLGGAVGGVLLPVLPEQLATWRRAAGGALIGILFAMFPLGYRLFDSD